MLTPFVSEHDDGLAVVAWLRKQPWFTGELGTFGQSYNGYAQRAIAAEAGPELRAITTSLIGSNAYDLLYPGGAMALELCLAWISMVAHQEKPVAACLSSIMLGRKKRAEAALPALLRDYQELRKAGRQPYLTIGPWQHWDADLSMAAVRESLAWLRAHLLKDESGLRAAPVRIYVKGAEEWRDLPVYPPAEARPQRLYLHPNGGLGGDLPAQSAPDRYRFDPADPTPAVTGMSRLIGIPRKTGESVLAGRDES
jgi:predicted acyl esterase